MGDGWVGTLRPAVRAKRRMSSAVLFPTVCRTVAREMEGLKNQQAEVAIMRMEKVKAVSSSVVIGYPFATRCSSVTVNHNACQTAMALEETLERPPGTTNRMRTNFEMPSTLLRSLMASLDSVGNSTKPCSIK